jgi:hypothetical protein
MVKSAAPLASVPKLGAGELERLDRLRRLAYLLDNSIAIPGTRYRIGLEALVGLVPGLGDLVGGGFSAWIILQAARLGAPPSLLARMGWTLLVDAAVGSIPLLGGTSPCWTGRFRGPRLRVARAAASSRSSRSS